MIITFISSLLPEVTSFGCSGRQNIDYKRTEVPFSKYLLEWINFFTIESYRFMLINCKLMLPLCYYNGSDIIICLHFYMHSENFLGLLY